MQVPVTNNYVTADGCIHHNSGKSTGCLEEILIRGIAQKPWIDGVRRTRFAVVRNTFGDLKRTTITTWERIIRKHFGSKLGFPKRRTEGYSHHLRFRNVADGTIIDCEVWFISLDGEDAIGKLMSLELTGAYFNEAYLISWPIIQEMQLRLGRYPSSEEGDYTWSGWWADTNAPDDSNWIFTKAEEETPPGWKFFKQPPAAMKVDGRWKVNPAAENVTNLPKGIAYYQDILDGGQAEDWIRVRLGNEYGFVQEGRLIIPDYVDSKHSSPEPLAYLTDVPVVYIGLDFGNTPAAAILQMAPSGQWLVIEELIADRVGLSAFIDDHLQPTMVKIKGMVPGVRFVVTGDPAGGQRSQTKAETPFKILHEAGIAADKAYTNNFEHRTEVLNRICRTDLAGQPRIVVSQSCRTLRGGMSRKYVFKKLRVVGDDGAEVFKTVPDKNDFSHVIEALEYGLMGAGEGENWGSSASSGEIDYSNRRLAS